MQDVVKDNELWARGAAEAHNNLEQSIPDMELVHIEGVHCPV